MLSPTTLCTLPQTAPPLLSPKHAVRGSQKSHFMHLSWAWRGGWVTSQSQSSMRRDTWGGGFSFTPYMCVTCASILYSLFFLNLSIKCPSLSSQKLKSCISFKAHLKILLHPILTPFHCTFSLIMNYPNKCSIHNP